MTGRSMEKDLMEFADKELGVSHAGFLILPEEHGILKMNYGVSARWNNKIYGVDMWLTMEAQDFLFDMVKLVLLEHCRKAVEALRKKAGEYPIDFNYTTEGVERND